ncbi:MAG: ABC transporter permease [Gemmatimonadales bacterium]
MDPLTIARRAIRALRQSPTVTLAALACIALGIGTSSAIFSAVNAVLLRPLPFRDPGSLVSVYRTTPHFDDGPFSPANFTDLRAGATQLEGLVAVATNVGLLERPEGGIRVSAFRASDQLFTLLGVRPLLGRVLEPGDDSPDQPLAALLSHDAWQHHFGGDRAVVGTTIHLDGDSYTVAGVLPARTTIPFGGRILRPDLWVPLRFTPDEATRRRNNYLLLMGRTREGSSLTAANDQLLAVMNGLVETHPELRGESLRMAPLVSESTKRLRTPLLMLLGAVGLLLLIASANVASLLLARASERRREIAIQTALGASRAEIRRHLLAESALLASLGAIVGLGLAWLGVGLVSDLAGARMPQLADLSIDLRVLGFALALALGVTAGAGFAPAARASRAEPHEALSATATRAGGARGQHRFLRALVVTEVGLSLVLLIGAGLILRGFADLIGRDPGFDPARLLTLKVSVSPERYPERDAATRFLDPALDAIAASPGVLDAAALNLIPYDNWGSNFNIRYEGREAADPTTLPLVESRATTPSLAPTLGLSLLRGRFLEPTDADPARDPVAVVNQALVDRDFEGADPIGRRFAVGQRFATIVGVVNNIKNFGPETDPRPEVYWAFGATPGWTTFPILVRTTGDPSTVASAVTAAIRRVDPTTAVSEVTPMTELMAQAVGTPRFYLVLFAAFAGVALVLSVAGLYGVTSYAVSRRTRELGIRAALGATRGRALRLVLAEAMGLVLLGVALGAAGAYAMSSLLERLLYGVSRLDPIAWGAVIGLVALSTVAAALLPARRAAKVEPLIAMRSE